MFPDLNSHEMVQILELVKFYMDQELRHRLMKELPQAYNHWMGGHYVTVVRDSDGKEV